MHYWKVLLITFLALFFAFATPAKLEAKRPVKFVIVIPSYNNEHLCIKNLESVVNQSYPHFTVVYVNDCSNDQTKKVVKTFIKARKLKKKITLINNKKRRGALENLYRVIKKVHPKKVVVTCDGDDWFATPYALDILASVYADKNIWMTYGDFRTTRPDWGSCCADIPEHIAQNLTFRSHNWVASHLRTFYAKLFHKVKRKDLLWQGKFFPMTWDMAMMFPMIEMASQGHYRFIKEILYIYNVDNPLCDYRVDAQLQRDVDAYIRSLPPYKALKKLF